MSNNEILRFRMNIGTGISCFIGAIGGIYLLFQGVKLLSKVSDRRHRKWRKSNELCPVCKNQVKLDDHINCVTCQGCSKIICRKPKCSDWIPKRGESDWECKLCFKTRQTHYKAGEWLLQKLNEKFHINGKLTVQDSSSDSDENFKDSLNSIPLEQKEKVREFLEDLLAEMVGGGTLDNVTVGPLQKSEEYLPLWDHECPGVSHINLKRKIQHIISEASKLSSTLNTSSSSAIPAQSLPYFDPKKYNELLATAVLNKIIDSYHNPANLPYPENSSGVHSGASDLDSNHNDLVKTGRERLNLMSLESELAKHIESGSSTGHPRTFSMGIDETDESPLASPPNSIATYSSSVSDTEGKYLESYIHKHKDRLPLPDLNNESESNDEDLQSLKSNDTDATWEDNWLFKSRKLKGESNNSIAMLVPSPMEEVKALIGDKNADEVSDLSEAEGDVDDDDVSSESSDEEHTESADIPNVLIQNKTIIGGKNHLSDLVEPKPEPEFESLTLQSLPSEAKNSAAFFEEDYVKISRRVIEIENSAATSSTDVVDSNSPAKISPSTLQDKDELSDEDLKPDEYRPTPAPRKSSHADISLTLNTDIAPAPEHVNTTNTNNAGDNKTSELENISTPDEKSWVMVDSNDCENVVESEVSNNDMDQDSLELEAEQGGHENHSVQVLTIAETPSEVKSIDLSPDIELTIGVANSKGAVKLSEDNSIQQLIDGDNPESRATVLHHGMHEALPLLKTFTDDSMKLLDVKKDSPALLSPIHETIDEPLARDHANPPPVPARRIQPITMPMTPPIIDELRAIVEESPTDENRDASTDEESLQQSENKIITTTEESVQEIKCLITNVESTPAAENIEETVQEIKPIILTTNVEPTPAREPVEELVQEIRSNILITSVESTLAPEPAEEHAQEIQSNILITNVEPTLAPESVEEPVQEINSNILITNVESTPVSEPTDEPVQEIQSNILITNVEPTPAPEPVEEPVQEIQSNILITNVESASAQEPIGEPVQEISSNILITNVESTPVPEPAEEHAQEIQSNILITNVEPTPAPESVEEPVQEINSNILITNVESTPAPEPVEGRTVQEIQSNILITNVEPIPVSETVEETVQEIKSIVLITNVESTPAPEPIEELVQEIPEIVEELVHEIKSNILITNIEQTTVSEPVEEPVQEIKLNILITNVESTPAPKPIEEPVQEIKSNILITSVEQTQAPEPVEEPVQEISSNILITNVETTPAPKPVQGISSNILIVNVEPTPTPEPVEETVQEIESNILITNFEPTPAPEPVEETVQEVKTNILITNVESTPAQEPVEEPVQEIQSNILITNVEPTPAPKSVEEPVQEIRSNILITNVEQTPAPRPVEEPVQEIQSNILIANVESTPEPKTVEEPVQDVKSNVLITSIEPTLAPEHVEETVQEIKSNILITNVKPTPATEPVEEPVQEISSNILITNVLAPEPSEETVLEINSNILIANVEPTPAQEPVEETVQEIQPNILITNVEPTPAPEPVEETVQENKTNILITNVESTPEPVEELVQEIKSNILIANVEPTPAPEPVEETVLEIKTNILITVVDEPVEKSVEIDQMQTSVEIDTSDYVMVPEQCNEQDESRFDEETTKPIQLESIESVHSEVKKLNEVDESTINNNSETAVIPVVTMDNNNNDAETIQQVSMDETPSPSTENSFTDDFVSTMYTDVSRIHPVRGLSVSGKISESTPTIQITSADALEDQSEEDVPIVLMPAASEPIEEDSEEVPRIVTALQKRISLEQLKEELNCCNLPKQEGQACDCPAVIEEPVRAQETVEAPEEILKVTIHQPIVLEPKPRVDLIKTVDISVNNDLVESLLHQTEITVLDVNSSKSSVENIDSMPTRQISFHDGNERVIVTSNVDADEAQLTELLNTVTVLQCQQVSYSTLQTSSEETSLSKPISDFDSIENDRTIDESSQSNFTSDGDSFLPHDIEDKPKIIQGIEKTTTREIIHGSVVREVTSVVQHSTGTATAEYQIEPQSTVDEDEQIKNILVATIEPASMPTATPQTSRYQSSLLAPLLPKTPPPPVVKVSNVLGLSPTHTTNTLTLELTNTSSTNEPQPIDDNEGDMQPIAGSIAEREHMKWQNAAPLENNPYSPENLQRRLSGKQSPGAFDYSGLSMASKHDEAAGDAGHDEVVLEKKETTEPERLADVFKHEKQDFQRKRRRRTKRRNVLKD